VGHFFDVITNGFGTAGISPACPGFAAQISPRDRWAIIAYVRALQLSQNVPAAQLTPDQRAQIGEGGAPR
jgi:mono/diheme cytochrome c family protein